MEQRTPVGPGTEPTRLLEREHELRAVESALDDARRGVGSMLVLEGEAGIGKSSIVEHATAVATRDGMRVLSSRSAEIEQIHPFGVALSLFGRLVREAPSVLSGPAVTASGLLEPSRIGDEQAPVVDRQAVIHGLYWLTINAAERDPLLVAIDDAHWADEASLEFIAYLGRRVRGLPVVLLTALRPLHGPGRHAAEHVRSHADAVRLRLSPLSADGVDALIRRSTERPGGAELRAEILSETGGIPFYVVELLRARGSGLEGSTAPASTTAAIPDPIAASIRRRLSDDSGVTRRVAEAIAILDDEAELDRATRLAGVSSDEAVEAIRRLTSRAILDPRRLAFIHPIARTAVYDAIPRAAAQKHHVAAARILAASGASPIAAAGHVMAVPPAADVEMVAILRNAARASLAAGDAPAAVSFLRRALDEDPDAQMLPSILLDLAKAEAAAGTPDAPSRFDDAIARLEDRHERVQARLAQGHALIRATRWAEAMKAFDAGLVEVDARDLELKSRLEAGYVSSAYVAMTDLDEANRRLEHILATPLRDPAHRELAAWAAFQNTLQVRGRAVETAALARRAVTDVQLDDLVHTSQAIEIVAGVFLATGDLVEEIDLLSRAIDAAQRVNAYGKVGVYAYCRSLPYYLTGRLQDAIADGETAVAAHEHGWEVFYPGSCAALAWAHLERGDVNAAEAVVSIDDERWGGRLDFEFMLRIARARVAWARGQLAEAQAELERVRDTGASMGVRSTYVLADWRTPLAVLLRSVDRRADAVRVAEEALDLATSWDEPIAIGRAEWALGMAVGGRTGIEHLRRSADHLSATVAVLEHARVTVDLGAALRRAGRQGEARDVLARAADLAYRIGASVMLERARSELAAAGARPRRYVVTGVGALTPAELRVARLAAQGQTNRAVAQALFVTPKAVEYHLANAYRKLGIGSRGELPAALSQEDARAAASV